MLTWNRRYLIHSVLHNIWRNNFPFKLVVIDNNSTDGTREFLLEHKDEIDTLILKRKNIGCAAFNEGIKEAEGNYLSIQADDHILPPNWMQKMYNAIRTVKRHIKNIGYISSAIHYAIPKKDTLSYLRNHKLPYEHWFGNAHIRIDPWKGTHERKTHFTIYHFDKVTYMDARAVGNGGTIIPLSTFKKIGLFRTYGLRGLYDGEWRGRCKLYGLRAGYTTNTAFVHVKEFHLRPKRVKEAYASIKPTAKQLKMLGRDQRENKKYAKKGVPPPSVPKL